MAFFGWPEGLLLSTAAADEECSDLITVFVDACATEERQVLNAVRRTGLGSPPVTPTTAGQVSSLAIRPEDWLRLHRKLVNIERHVQQQRQFAQASSSAAEAHKPGLNAGTSKVEPLPKASEWPAGSDSDPESPVGLAGHKAWWAKPTDTHPLYQPLPPPAITTRLVPRSAGDRDPALQRSSTADMSTPPAISCVATWDSTESSSETPTVPDTRSRDLSSPDRRTQFTSSPDSSAPPSPTPAPAGSAQHSPSSPGATEEGSTTTVDSSRKDDESSMSSGHKLWRRSQAMLIAQRSGSLQGCRSLRHVASTQGLCHAQAALSSSAPVAGPSDLLKRVASLPVLRHAASLSLLPGAGPAADAPHTDPDTPQPPASARSAAPRRAHRGSTGTRLTESALLASRQSVRENILGWRMQRWLLDVVRLTQADAPEAMPDASLVTARTWSGQLKQLGRSLNRGWRHACRHTATTLFQVQAAAQYVGTSSIGTLRAAYSRFLWTIAGSCVARRKAVELVDRRVRKSALRPASTAARAAAARHLAGMGPAGRGGGSGTLTPFAASSLPNTRSSCVWVDSSDEDEPDAHTHINTHTNTNVSQGSSKPSEAGRDDDTSSSSSSGLVGPAVLARQRREWLQRAAHAAPAWHTARDAAGAARGGSGVGSVAMSSVVARPSLDRPSAQRGSSPGASVCGSVVSVSTLGAPTATAGYSALSLTDTDLTQLRQPFFLNTDGAQPARDLRHILHDDARMRVTSFTLPAGYRIKAVRSHPWSGTLQVVCGSVTATLSHAQDTALSRAPSLAASRRSIDNSAAQDAAAASAAAQTAGPSAAPAPSAAAPAAWTRPVVRQASLPGLSRSTSLAGSQQSVSMSDTSCQVLRLSVGSVLAVDKDVRVSLHANTPNTAVVMLVALKL